MPEHPTSDDTDEQVQQPGDLFEPSGLVGEPVPASDHTDRHVSREARRHLEEIKRQVAEKHGEADEAEAGTSSDTGDGPLIPGEGIDPESVLAELAEQVKAGGAVSASIDTDEPLQEGAADDEVRMHDRAPAASTLYEELVNWDARISRETPLFHRVFSDAGVHSVVDVGCGTGHRTVLFGQWGMRATGIDAAGPLLSRAEERAAEVADEISRAHGEVSFKNGDLGAIADALNLEKAEALICMGDILPRVGSLSALRYVLDDFFDALIPSGMLVLEFANHTLYTGRKQRTTPPQAFDTVEGTKVFMSVMDYPAGSTIINADNLTLSRNREGKWSIRNNRIQNLFITQPGITRELTDAGFDVLEVSGDMNATPFDQYDDTSMVIVARRKRHNSRSKRETV